MALIGSRPALFRFRRAAEDKANEIKGLRFAAQNESFRDEASKPLKSLRAPNQPFRGIVCSQWVEPCFVSQRFRFGFLPRVFLTRPGGVSL
jgi:hypothetical protein